MINWLWVIDILVLVEDCCNFMFKVKLDIGLNIGLRFVLLKGKVLCLFKLYLKFFFVLDFVNLIYDKYF